jgi:two-component system phosphate regulon sensor histidine kinase PhoR
LSSIVEGVLAVNMDGEILSLNESAERLLAIEAEKAKGRSIEEAIRNADLHRFVRLALGSSEPVSGEIAFPGQPERVLKAQSSILRDAEERRIGVVAVLHDVTELRRLDNVRSEFVANVSHELMTPITSIKGFVETLQGGALNDPLQANRFLEIIAKHAARLQQIVEDLLNLSKIECDARTRRIPLERCALADPLHAAVAFCRSKAEEKNIAIRLDCGEDLVATINPRLLEQAAVNLIDNAVKYSEPGTEVEVSAKTSDTETTVEVKDHGCGIAPEHLPRVFERFYRVDRSRSRELGGTGLGLSIVKHIVKAHNGDVTVESTPGIGSRFIIHLPNP